MKIDSALSAAIAADAGKQGELPVIINVERQEDVALLVEKGLTPRLVYASIPAAAATLTPDQIRRLAAEPHVTLIELDTEAAAMSHH